MNAPERIKVVERDAADVIQRIGFELYKTHTNWLGIAVLGIGGGMTLLWIAFILWLSGYMIGIW
jgi:hypothetical protein